MNLLIIDEKIEPRLLKFDPVYMFGLLEMINNYEKCLIFKSKTQVSFVHIVSLTLDDEVENNFFDFMALRFFMYSYFDIQIFSKVFKIRVD